MKMFLLKFRSQNNQHYQMVQNPVNQTQHLINPHHLQQQNQMLQLNHQLGKCALVKTVQKVKFKKHTFYILRL